MRNENFKGHPYYIELLEDKDTYGAKQEEIRTQRAAEKKRLREEDPEANLDWFMKGSIAELTQNLVKITNDRDKERLILRKGVRQ